MGAASAAVPFSPDLFRGLLRNVASMRAACVVLILAGASAGTVMEAKSVCSLAPLAPSFCKVILFLVSEVSCPRMRASSNHRPLSGSQPVISPRIIPMRGGYWIVRMRG
jgi:hypothetical protein